MRRYRKNLRTISFEPLEARNLLAADPIISEFMASNQNTIFDGNGDTSDWIELYNKGDETVDLAGFGLTDDALDPYQWVFPSTPLDPGEFLVVFASGTNAIDSAGYLHTNFRLSASGEHLRLTDPLGSLVSEFAAGGNDYPPQFEDVSYGIGFTTNILDAVTSDSVSKYLVPTNASVDATWMEPSFNDDTWAIGTASLGYENSNGGYDNVYQTELPSGTTTAYVRIPFNVTDGASQLTTLSMKYDDGFVAYLNGTPIEMENEPASLHYQATADGEHLDAAALAYVEFDVSEFSPLLNLGQNVLAIHMLNRSSGSSDLLAAAKLELISGEIGLTEAEGALLSPSPGLPNSLVTAGDVSFSHDGGVFTNAFQLTLATPEPTEVIRYTLDGSVPNTGSPLFANPISIISSTQVRASAFGAEGQMGKPFGESYTLSDAATNNFTSDLPIIVIENHGGGIPGKDAFGDGYISVYDVDPSTGRSAVSDPVDFSMKLGFHRRGSSTLNNPKPALRVELRDDSGNDQAVEFLGMPSESDWVLLAPYLFDRAMLRDTFFLEVNAQMGNYAPRTRFVEVYGNTNGGLLTASDYLGVYVLMENIKQDANRVDISKLTPQDNTGSDVTGGYIIKIDRSDGTRGASWTSSRGNSYVHYEPERADMTPAQVVYIRGHIEEFEDALYGPDATDPILGYEAYFDVDAAIDYHLTKILAKDPDALRLSTYFHKDKDGKIAFGPVWDFDRTAGPDSDGRAANPRGWDANEAPFFGYKWWGELFSDPDFMQRWIDRWQDLRIDELSDAGITAIVDVQSEEIAEAQARNFARWPAVSPNGGPYADAGLTGWDGEVSHLKNWILARAEWMDTQMVSPPSLPPSGTVANDTQIILTSNEEEDLVYYTLDGSDPRGDDGAISPSAQRYNDPLAVTTELDLRARSFRTASSALSEWSSSVSRSYTTAIAGDFNGNGQLDCTDIHALGAIVVAGAIGPLYDVDGSGSVDADDVVHWITELRETQVGDANLDGVVDALDFATWNSHRFTETASFCDGDFNTDGIADVSDFNIWSNARNAIQAVAAEAVDETFARFDTSRDGSISPMDALAVMDHMNQGEADFDPSLDVNADGLVSPLDALLVINHLNARLAPNATVGGNSTGTPSPGMDSVFDNDDDDEEYRAKWNS